jgi:probable F420-dependent oxidoreductase
MTTFHFGVLPFSESFDHKFWPQLAQQVEHLGYSGLYKEDHLDRESYDPFSILSTVAANTSTINIGTLVLCVDYRHPVILAQAAATLQSLSNNRYEFGIGAGWMESEYTQSGIPYHKPSTRIRKLDEALTIIKSMWLNDKTSLNGKYFKISEIERTGSLSEDNMPKIMIGAGGKMSLGVAGKHADIVSLVPKVSPAWPPQEFKKYNLDVLKEKISWVKESATKHDRDPKAIEFALFSPRDVIVSDDVDDHIEAKSKRYGISRDDYLNLPSTFVGSGEEIREKLTYIKEETGVNRLQFTVSGPDMVKELESFSAQVIKPLS